MRQVEATILSGSWPNESLLAKQFATFSLARQTLARAGQGRDALAARTPVLVARHSRRVHGCRR